MTKLKAPIVFETTFGEYTATDLLGEGGAGRVFAGTGPDQALIAIKVLAADRVTTDKRRRFKNEIGFLAQTRHENIVPFIDRGIASGGQFPGPFYVMPRYSGSLRQLIGAPIAPDQAFAFFGQILDGVEAAHLKGAVHRDLKPENILFNQQRNSLAIADFGVASFTADVVETLVETAPTARLANFMYAAPEQRSPGLTVGLPADIYALGLILNEMFTQTVPHGTEYAVVGAKHANYAFLDAVVAKMIRQAPKDRFQSIAELKQAIQHHRADFVGKQKISKLDATVIREGAIDDPLALEVPKVIDARWIDNRLYIDLDQVVSDEWAESFRSLGNYEAVMGITPKQFTFNKNVALVSAAADDAQRVINYFKQWLPHVTAIHRAKIERNEQSRIANEREQIRRLKEREERILEVNSRLKI